jgi:hypothetical protein
MPNFVKLPSGKLVNLDSITYSFPLDETKDEKERSFLFFYQGGGENENTVIYDADARALYAYMSNQAVTIDETGTEVEPETAEGELSRLDLNILGHLHNYREGREIYALSHDFPLDTDVIHRLRKEGYLEGIGGAGDPWVLVLTQKGRDAYKDGSK